MNSIFPRRGGRAGIRYAGSNSAVDGDGGTERRSGMRAGPRDRVRHAIPRRVRRGLCGHQEQPVYVGSDGNPLRSLRLTTRILVMCCVKLAHSAGPLLGKDGITRMMGSDGLRTTIRNRVFALRCELAGLPVSGPLAGARDRELRL